MALKRDDSFLQYLTMGAIGSARAAADLNNRGHQIIELERYTTSNKIWATKIKRLRLPDLLCLRCGRRIEVRAKSKLEVKVSDSPAVAAREWDAGLGNDDLIAFIQVSWNGTVAIPSEWIDYFRVADLRATVASSRLGPPKSATEGAERDRTWPASTLSYPARVDAVSQTHITMARGDGSTRRVPLRTGFFSYVNPGDIVGAGNRLITGVASKPPSVTCPGDLWQLTEQAHEADLGQRYAAVKALGFCGDPEEAARRLEATWNNAGEDVRIRLEALGGLARRDPESWVRVLSEKLGTLNADMAMETVFILSELPAPQAAEELGKIVANTALPEELRAAAAWGQGIGGHHKPEPLFDYLEDLSDEVATHCLIAIGSGLTEAQLEHIADRIAQSDRAAASAVHVLARHGATGARVLLRRVGTFDSQRRNAWVLFGLGLLGRAIVTEAATGQAPSGLLDSLEPLFLGVRESWLSGERSIALDFLSRQTVREAIMT